MSTYFIEFLDHGDNVYLSQSIECASDDEAIAAVHRINSPRIGAGFDVWRGDRLVHRHRNREGSAR